MKLIAKAIVWVGLWIAGALMMGLVIFTVLGIYGQAADVHEDDITFNCYVMGNLDCGESAVWHGFVNF